MSQLFLFIRGKMRLRRRLAVSMEHMPKPHKIPKIKNVIFKMALIILYFHPHIAFRSTMTFIIKPAGAGIILVCFLLFTPLLID